MFTNSIRVEINDFELPAFLKTTLEVNAMTLMLVLTKAGVRTRGEVSTANALQVIKAQRVKILTSVIGQLVMSTLNVSTQIRALVLYSKSNLPILSP